MKPPWTSPRSVLSALLATLALAGGAWYLLGRSNQGPAPSWTNEDAQAAVQRSSWDDERIVLGTECLTLNPQIQTRAAETAILATRFDCRVSFVRRPSTVTPGEWDEMADAIRTGNVARAMSLLQVQPGASDADVAVASRRWGLDGSLTVSEVIGVQATSSRRLHRVASHFDGATFGEAAQLRHELLAAIPSIEAFYADHHTYLGVTFQALRAIDANVSELVTIPEATGSSYCAEIESGPITWSESGPRGAPRPERCQA